MTNSRNRIIANNTIIMYIRMIFTSLISLYISREILNILGVTDFGIYNVVGGLVAMFGFISSAMATATQRYLSYNIGTNNSQLLKNIFNASLIIHIAIAFLLLILIGTIGVWFLNNYLNIEDQKLSSARWVLHLTAISTVFIVIRVPYSSSILAHENIKVYATLSIIEVILKLIFVLIIKIIEFDKLLLYSLSILISTFIVFFLNILYSHRNYNECKLKIVKDSRLYLELIKYSGWSLISTISTLGYTQGVNILLNIFYGPAINAARGIAFQVQSTARIFVTNFQLAVNPQIIKSFAKKDLHYNHNLIKSSSKYSYFLLLYLAFPIIFETKYILNLWLVEVPEYTITFTKLVIINVMIDTLAGPLMTASHSTGNIKIYQITIGFLLLLNLPISYFLLKLKLEPESTFYVSILLASISLIVRLIILEPQIKLRINDFLLNVIFKVALVTSLSMIIPFMVILTLDSSFSRFLILILTSTLSISLSISFLGLNKLEKDFITHKIISTYKSYL